MESIAISPKNALKPREIAGNEDTGLLKIIALVCMIIDHVGARICPQTRELRIIGRIAFPLYMWCMVVGACHTRCPWRYALRLLLVGVIAQPCYMLGLNHEWTKLSVYATLFLGYLGIWGIRENKGGSRYWAPLIVLAIPCFVPMDYGWRGVLLIMLLYLARQRRGSILAVMVAYCLFWGGTVSPEQKFLGLSLNDLFKNIPLLSTVFREFSTYFLRIQTLALLAVPLMLWPRRTRTPLPKWAGYAAYPGHLLILWLVELSMGIMTMAQSLKLLFPWR
ncbi:MAG: hypothetical protein IJS53_00585 [Clostridia bacterium]|nr:hypothetical protein [Clostridia bacterium]